MGRSIQSVIVKTLLKRDQRSSVNTPVVNEHLGGTGGTVFSPVPGHHTTHEAGGSDVVSGGGGSAPVFSPTAPLAPTLHEIWINTTLNTEQYWDGAQWILLTSITTAPGIYSTTGLPLIITCIVPQVSITGLTTGSITSNLLSDVSPVDTSQAVSVNASSGITNPLGNITILIV